MSEVEDHGTALALDFLTKPVAAVELARAWPGRVSKRARATANASSWSWTTTPGFWSCMPACSRSWPRQCRILKAHNGGEALKVMAHQPPDLVLLDLMMPVLDGFGVLEAMRERESTRNVPVIVLTAQILTSQDMARLQQGVAAVLSKGLFTGAEVLAQVTDALGRSKRLGSEAQRVVRQAMAYIHEHYAEPFSREALAAAVGLSDRYLTRCFHEETGITPIAYLNRTALQQARALLERGRIERHRGRARHRLLRSQLLRARLPRGSRRGPARLSTRGAGRREPGAAPQQDRLAPRRRVPSISPRLPFHFSETLRHICG